MRDTWTVYDDREKNGRIEIAKMGRTVARLYYKDDEALKDARLIAAAPDLLGAMRFVLAFYEPGQRVLDTEAWKVAEAQARAAVAKAEGNP